MTKKHFIGLAQTSRDAREFLTYSCWPHQEEAFAMIAYLEQHIAAMCQEQNAQFDRQRFLTACRGKAHAE